MSGSRLVTVCIPAFDSHPFITSTLDSLCAQTFMLFKVIVAIEPTSNQHLIQEICNSYRDRLNIESKINPEILGWAGNINNLLAEVSTPYYLILPHDDVLHPYYISTLFREIEKRPRTLVAYADMQIFGAIQGVKYRDYQGRNKLHRLTKFFLGGAEAVPWRGITRTVLLKEGLLFQTNQWNSIWVECEYALSLLNRGRVFRLPKPLYLKRNHGDAHTSVSKSWGKLPKGEQRTKAVDHHIRSMWGIVESAGLSAKKRTQLSILFEAAMIRRQQGLLPLDEVEKNLGAVMEKIEDSNGLNKDLAKGMVQTVHANLLLRKGEIAAAELKVKESIVCHPTYGEALILMAEIKARSNQPFKAMEWLDRAQPYVNNTVRSNQIMKRIYEQF